MDIDPTQPWGIAIDYAGRATVVEEGHTVDVYLFDTGLSPVIQPDPITGRYPVVHITAQISESGGLDCELRGYGEVIVEPAGTAPLVPDRNAVANAVAAALADFNARTTAYSALCATWTVDSGGPEAPATASAAAPAATGGTATA